MKTIRYEFILRALQPINHQSETVGNEGVIMREPIRLPGGRYADVPIITGDTCRSGLRRAAAWALLDAAGLIEHPCLGEAAIRLLFAGGMVTGKGSASNINLDTYRRLTELVPSMKLLGGCSDSRVIPGMSEVDVALLLCRETEWHFREYSPWMLDWLAANGEPLNPARMDVEEEQRVRMDPALVPELRQLMNADAQVSVNRRLQSSEAAHTTDDAAGQIEAKSTMMPRRFEVVKRGALFGWGLQCRTYTPLDEDTLNVAVAAWLSDARVGGKKGTGHGLMRPIPGAARNITVQPISRSMDSLALDGMRIGDLFRAHVSERRDAIREMLATVDA